MSLQPEHGPVLQGGGRALIPGPQDVASLTMGHTFPLNGFDPWREEKRWGEPRRALDGTSETEQSLTK